MDTMKFVIGENSQQLLKALTAFREFQNAYMDALTAIYGEKEGAQDYQAIFDHVEAIERDIMEYLRVQITWNMGTGAEVITI